MALIGAVFVVLFLWIGLDASVIDGEGRGPGARLARSIGPDALRLLSLACATAVAVMLFLYARLLGSRDNLAARANQNGIMVRSLFGRVEHLWPEVESLFLRRVPSPAGEQVLVVLRPQGGRQIGIAVNALEEDADEAEAWLVAADALRLAGQGNRHPA